jgi:hypothetical protein
MKLGVAKVKKRCGGDEGVAARICYQKDIGREA